MQPVRHDPDADYLFLLFTVMLSWTLLERGPPNLAEAFADLGMNPSRAFLMISVPLSMPGIAAGFTLSLCPSYGVLISPFLVVSQEGNLIALVIQTHFGPALKWPLGLALSIVMLEIILSIVSLSDRVKRGSATGGA